MHASRPLNKIMLRLANQTNWAHHLVQWKKVLECLSHLDTQEGIPLCGYLDEATVDMMISKRFIGFLHHVPVINYDKMRGLKYFINGDFWLAHHRRCLGLFTLTKYTADYLKRLTNVPIQALTYPIIRPPVALFEWDKFIHNKNRSVIFVGGFLRRFTDFLAVVSHVIPKKVLMMRCYLESGIRPTEDIDKIYYLDAGAYEDMLSMNIIFSSYHDVAVSNTIMECINSNTPLLTNRLPASEEYLGTNYPGFYDDILDACDLINDLGRIKAAHDYLRHMDKTRFSLLNFVRTFEQSQIYNDLPFIEKAFV